MENKLVKLSEYIKETKQNNNESKTTDARLNFFYNKKLNTIFLTKRSLVYKEEYVKTSTTTIRPIILDKNLKKYNLSKLTPSEKEDYIMTNLEKLFCDPTYLAAIAEAETSILKENDFMPDSKLYIHLDNLEVNPKFRNYGFATKLISELIHTGINIDILNIKATMLPLDVKGYVYSCVKNHTPLYYKILNNISYKTNLFKSKAFIDKETLLKIYTKLGFKVIGFDQMANSELLGMNIDKNAVNPSELLPTNYTNYQRNNDLCIIHT